MKKAKRNGKKHIPWFCQVVEAETLRRPAGTSPVLRRCAPRPSGAAGWGAARGRGGQCAVAHRLWRYRCWRQRCPRRSSPCVSWAPARYQSWRGPLLVQQTATTGPRARRRGRQPPRQRPRAAGASPGGAHRASGGLRTRGDDRGRPVGRPLLVCAWVVREQPRGAAGMGWEGGATT